MMYINEMHNQICEKLGFDPVHMLSKIPDDIKTEDDNRKSLVEGLTQEELEFVAEHRMKFLGIT